MDKITALICAYNASKTIKRTILSVSFQVNEIIIIDDGSTDNTIVEIESLHDPKITLVRSHKNKGIGHSRQIALEACRTKYALWIDADDECLADRVSILLPFLREGASWVYDSVELYNGQTEIFNKNMVIPSFLTAKDGILHQLARNYLPAIGCPMVNVEHALKIGYDTTLRHGEDYDHFLRALLSGAEIALSPAITYRIYEYSSSLSRKLDVQNTYVESVMKRVAHAQIEQLLTCSSLAKETQLSIMLLRALKVNDVSKLKEILSYIPSATTNRDPDFRWLTAFSNAMVSYSTRDYPAATKNFLVALQIERSADVCNNLGVLQFLMNKSGREYFLEALEIFPGYQDAKINLLNNDKRMTCVPLRKQKSRNRYIK